MDSHLKERLEQRKEQKTLRSLSPLTGTIDFYSNDYLGCAKSPVSFAESGSTGSRLISGTSQAMVEAEYKMAAFFDAEAALFFNSGYDANLGFFSSVPQRNDTVLYDQFIHASVRDGLRLGNARSHSFLHNDLSDLEKQLKRTEGTVYVAVESLYSMDGDFAPLLKIADLCQRYKALLVVDEAHAGGIFGRQGRGYVDELDCHPQVYARLITFGKAYGSHGACWLGSEVLKDYLLNFSRPFIYTTALPSAVFSHNASLLENGGLDASRSQLMELIDYFRAKLKLSETLSDPRSPIQIIEVGSIETAIKIARLCSDKGICVKPIFAPTVPEGRERLRICLHAFNTEKEINTLLEIIHTQR